MKKPFLVSLSIFSLLIIGTLLIVLYGRGYRLKFQDGKAQLSGTGLLATSSIPKGAEVFINNHLTTATDNTIDLLPGEYKIKIFKEGYFPWEKKIRIQKEVVAEANALLFPTAPKLENITASGIDNPTIDPSLTQIAYTTASQSARKNGIYVLDMAPRSLLTLQSSTQITDETVDNFSKASLSWTPDGKQIIATVSASVRGVPTAYLLKTNSFNDNPQDITEIMGSLEIQWVREKQEKEKARLGGLKPKLRELITSYLSIIEWSSDETKILYIASQSATIPIIIHPPLIGANTSIEDRKIKKDNLYVYDIKEDKNYRVLNELPTPTTYLRWYPDSKHLIYVHDNKIEMMEYDGTNQTTVYAGPFAENYVFPWPSGSKILILTNLNNPTIPPNLYTIGLK